MPLGEALLFLKRGIKRSFGSDVRVRLVDPQGLEGREYTWKDQRPLPLVIIDGDVVFKGDVPVRQIVEEVARRKTSRRG